MSSNVTVVALRRGRGLKYNQMSPCFWIHSVALRRGRGLKLSNGADGVFLENVALRRGRGLKFIFHATLRWSFMSPSVEGVD